MECEKIKEGVYWTHIDLTPAQKSMGHGVDGRKEIKLRQNMEKANGCLKGEKDGVEGRNTLMRMSAKRRRSITNLSLPATRS